MLRSRPEHILHFAVTGLTGDTALAANCQAEVWAMRPGGNVMLGYIGDRACARKMFSRTFGPENLVVRMHWVRVVPRGSGSSWTTITCRRAADQALLWVSDPRAKVALTLEDGYVVGERSCSQQPRQAGFYATPPRQVLPMVRHVGKTFGEVQQVMAAQVKPLEATALAVVQTYERKPSEAAPERLLAPMDVADPVASSVALPCLHALAMDNQTLLHHRVFDLGSIAHHRFVVTTGPDSPAVLLYSEVPTMGQMRTGNRVKTKLADFVGSRCAGRVFGVRGCRYLHVLQDPGALPPVVAAWRLEYPLHLWDVEQVVAAAPHPRAGAILRAVYRNLAACVTGEAVEDTCWRERTQWTGDTAVVLEALTKLTSDGAPEVVGHITTQIADSYNPALGMVAAITPEPAHASLYIPLYHLLFCLLAARVDGVSTKAAKVIDRSITLWRHRYVRDGLLHVPGADARVWHFIDWSAGVSSRDKSTSIMDCNSVLNAVWVQLHHELGRDDHGIDFLKFQEAFAVGDAAPGAYSVVKGSGEPSVHATTNAILAGLAPDLAASAAALQAQLTRWRESEVPLDDWSHGGPTAFYGGYVCDALRLCEAVGALPPGSALYQAIGHYAPMAEKHGTLLEKKADNASLAHAWSVGVVRQVFDYDSFVLEKHIEEA